MATPVMVSTLPLATEFRTTLTARRGCVIDRQHENGSGVRCVLGEGETVLHPNVLVIPEGRIWRSRRIA